MLIRQTLGLMLIVEMSCLVAKSR